MAKEGKPTIKEVSLGNDSANLKIEKPSDEISAEDKIKILSDYTFHYGNRFYIHGDLRQGNILALNAKELIFIDASHPAPPSSAFLSALLPLSVGEDVIENLNEVFKKAWLPRHGARTARRIWRTNATLIVVRFWLSPLILLLDRIKQLKTGG
jgi:RIO-like serine/threonine protein kinase